MDMVAHRIDFNERRPLVLQDAGNIAVQLLALLIPEKHLPVLGAEYEMDGVLYEGLRHGENALTGLGRYCKSHSRACARETRSSDSPAHQPPLTPSSSSPGWYIRGFQPHGVSIQQVSAYGAALVPRSTPGW